MVVGYIYDILGRTWTTFGSVFLIGLFIFLIPLAAPLVYPWLFILRSSIASVFMGMSCHPYNADYVKKESRGKAIALQNIAAFFGGITGIIMLFIIVSRLNIGMQFQLVGIIGMVVSFGFFFLIKEPKVTAKHVNLLKSNPEEPGLD